VNINYVHIVFKKERSDDDDCRIVIPERGTSVYVRVPYVVVENRSFKVSLEIEKVRFSVVLPQHELIMFDDKNRVQVEFDDSSEVDALMTYIRNFKNLSA
jgi:hypothetical protein